MWYKKSNKPVDDFLMLTHQLVPWLRLADWTQDDHKQLEHQNEENQTRNPQQANGAFVTELVPYGEAEVGEVKQDQTHQQSNLNVELMLDAELHQGWSNAYDDEGASAAAIAFFIVVLEPDVVFFFAIYLRLLSPF